MVKKTVKPIKKSVAKTTAAKKPAIRAKSSKQTVAKDYHPELVMWLTVTLGVSSMLLFAFLSKMSLGS